MIDERLRFALKERTLLLREVHHRVKNNLNVIHSLIGLQIGNLKDASSVDLLNDLSRRIGSMAFVHDQLNERPYTGALRLSRYIPTLVDHILASHTAGEVAASYRIDDEIPDLSLSRATALGLIVNEVVVNSLKHAFGSVTNPDLSIKAKSSRDFITLTITDNGPGIHPESVRPGLGFGLIQALARQLEGEYQYITTAGTEFSLSIPVEDLSNPLHR
jgi:two-component sensor histidine kinase